MSLYPNICDQNSAIQYLQVALMSIRVMLTLHGAGATWSAISLSVTEPSSSSTRYSVGSKPMLMAKYDVKITQRTQCHIRTLTIYLITYPDRNNSSYSHDRVIHFVCTYVCMHLCMYVIMYVWTTNFMEHRCLSHEKVIIIQQSGLAT